MFGCAAKPDFSAHLRLSRLLIVETWSIGTPWTLTGSLPASVFGWLLEHRHQTLGI